MSKSRQIVQLQHLKHLKYSILTTILIICYRLKNYKKFVEDTDAENPDINLNGCILGHENFVNWIKENFLSGSKEDTEIPQLKKLKPKPAPDAIVEVVCEELSAEKESVLKRGVERISDIMERMKTFSRKDTEGITQGELIGEIMLAQRILRQPVYPREQLESKSLDELKSIFGEIEEKLDLTCH